MTQGRDAVSCRVTARLAFSVLSCLSKQNVSYQAVRPSFFSFIIESEANLLQLFSSRKHPSEHEETFRGNWRWQSCKLVFLETSFSITVDSRCTPRNSSTKKNFFFIFPDVGFSVFTWVVSFCTLRPIQTYTFVSSQQRFLSSGGRAICLRESTKRLGGIGHTSYKSLSTSFVARSLRRTFVYQHVPVSFISNLYF